MTRLVGGVALFCVAVAGAEGPRSDAVAAPRPKGGEWMGVYLMGKKVGYDFVDLAPDPADPSRVISTNLFYFKANLSGKASERRRLETRTYEAKPNGRLVSVSIEQTGDGGDQLLQGTATAEGLSFIIKRPGQPNQVKSTSWKMNPALRGKSLAPPREHVEDADQVRVALARKAPVHGTILDGIDLEPFDVTTTPEKPEERLIRGVKVKLLHARTVSEKDKVPIDTYVTEAGETVEVDLGPTMRALAEPEAVAKRLEDVDVFALTRIVLPRRLPDDVRKVPNQVTLVLTGLPDAFLHNDYRQSFKRLDADRVAVTVTAAAPAHPAPVKFPLADPAGGENLKNALAMDLDNPDIRAAARTAVGGEKDAYAAAKRIVAWVGSHMTKAYGSSSDRASDALRRMRGDCTEHSLLSVAMMRSVGIPAKRIDGLVYVDNSSGVPALLWHEWVEAYVGQWTQLDPTFEEPVTDAAHLALGEETQEKIVPLIGQLKVVEVP